MDPANFTLGQSQPLIPSFNLFYAQLRRCVQLPADHGGWQRWFFAGIAIAIVAVLLVMMYRSTAQQKLNNIAYAFIIGGVGQSVRSPVARFRGRFHRLLRR